MAKRKTAATVSDPPEPVVGMRIRGPGVKDDRPPDVRVTAVDGAMVTLADVGGSWQMTRNSVEIQFRTGVYRLAEPDPSQDAPSENKPST